MNAVDVQTWGQMTTITKEFLSDAAIYAHAFVDESFRRSLPLGFEVLGDPSYEWIDLDAPENMFMRQMMTPEDGEPPENMWLVRCTARIVGGAS